MADEKAAEEKPKNKTRKSTWFTWLVMAPLSLFGGYSGYQRFVVDKPLYDTFLTRTEGGMISTRIDDLRTAIVGTQSSVDSLRAENREGFKEIKLMFENQRQANNAIHQTLLVDVANLKFIVGYETKKKPETK